MARLSRLRFARARASASGRWCRSPLQRDDLSDGLIFDAVRIRLLEIGEAVKALPDDL